MHRVVVIDTETTGLSPMKGGHRVINLAGVEIVDGKPTGNVFNTYINPEGKKSTPKALKVHRLTDEFLSRQPKFSDIAEKFFKFIDGAELSFYNRDFDMSFLQAEYDRCGFDVVFSRDFESSCLMLDFATKENSGKWIKLDSACIRYGIDISQRKVHGAAIDAELAASLYIELHHSNERPLDRTPHQNERNQKESLPIPRAYNHPESSELIQLNHCKNPNCSNYGVPALNPTRKKTGEPKRGLGNDYKFTNSRNGKSLTCKLCGSSTKLVNNRAFVLESIRIRSLYSTAPRPCPDKGLKNSRRRKRPCRNSGVDFLKKPSRYTLRGLNYSTFKGQEHLAAQRIECNACKNQFNLPLNGQYGH